MNVIRKKLKLNIFPIVILFISTIMSIGYAAVNSVLIDITGKTTAQAVSGVFITHTNYKSNNNADLSNSKIITAYQTTLKSKILLSDSDINSNITYEITIYNSKPYPMAFDGTNYILGEDTYSNDSIGFNIDGMTLGEVIQPNQEKTYTITFSYNNSSITNNVLNSIINFKFVAVPTIIGEYDYTGKIETLNIPYSGVFKLEVWGGQGGNANKSTGGYGSYSVGEIALNANQQLSIVVAGKGGDCTDYKKCSEGGYNGGGSACGNFDTYFASGGGATHIATASGLLSSLSNNKTAILIVAGGGGGAGYYTGNTASYYGKINNGGHAGGYTGVNGGGPSYGIGGTQTAGGKGNTTGNAVNGSFGAGGGKTSNIASGGGSGYFGGGTGFDFGSAAGGGTGYIANANLKNKHMACYSCSTSTAESTKTISVGNVSASPIADYAKLENGYARITFIAEI